MSVPPPGMTQEKWVRLLDQCRQLDGRYNRAEDVGKPRLTCENGTRSNAGSTKLEVGPGGASTPPDPASTSVEGASNGER